MGVYGIWYYVYRFMWGCMGCRIIVFRVIVYNGYHETQCEDYDSPVGNSAVYGGVWYVVYCIGVQ